MESTIDFIRHPTLQGTHNIVGIWFPTYWFTSKQRRSLLIKYWSLGCAIYQFEQGDLLKFATAQPLNCDRLEGWPLILQNGIMCSTQLDQTFDSKLAGHDLVIINGNQMTKYRYQDAINIDPAKWLDLTEYQLLTTENYTINVVYDEIPDQIEEIKSIEQIFAGKIPSSSPKMLKYIKWRQKNYQQKSDKYSNAANSDSVRQSAKKNYSILWITLVSILFYFWLVIEPPLNKTPRTYNLSSVNIFDALKCTLIFFIILLIVERIIKFVIFIRTVKQGKESNHILVKKFSFQIKYDDLRQNHQPNHSSLPERQKTEQSKPSRWRFYLSLFTIFSKLSHLITSRQANYLEKMLKKFESGDLLDALRYAIPINGNGRSVGQSFGVPKPRDKLSLSESVYGDALSISIDDALEKRLQLLYRQSFEKLANQNKIEEAVFVLVELLNNLKQGIEFLEQHKRYKQAMELAIARDAEPELIVKLCCLANDWDKAVMVARRDNIFANAILLLTKEQPELANKLRVEWAKTLAEKAEWIAAIEAIWPLAEFRYLAEQWFYHIDKFNAKAIVKRFILLPDSMDQLEESLLIIKNHPDYYQTRLDIAEQILEHQHDIVKLRGLLRILINVIIADVITYPNNLTKPDITKLIALTKDEALKIDIPVSSLKFIRHQALWESTCLLRFSCPEVGYRTIYNMVALTNNNYLLALGEAGIIMVNNQGKQLAHFMIVAEKLVISYNRLQVLILAKRDDYYRIHKLDLSTRESVDLGVIRFKLYHPLFDGINWTIVHDNCIEVINISNRLSVVWRVDLSPNSIIQMVKKDDRETYLTINQLQKIELFSYSLPEHRLIQRKNLGVITNKIITTDSLGMLYFSYDSITQQLLYQYYNNKKILLKMTQQQFDNLHILTTGETIVLVVNRSNDVGYDIHFYHPDNDKIIMTIDWHVTSQISYLYYDGEYCFFDEQGRALHVNVNESNVTAFSV